MKLLILDGNSVVNRAFYGVRSALTNSEGIPTNAVYGFTKLFLRCVDEYKPDRTVCAFDRREPTFRHKMYSGYKATRKGMPEELAVQMPLLKELLDVMQVPRLELAGYEADDIIGTVSAMCAAAGDECIIVTGDRDDLQLIGGGVRVALTVTKEHETVTELLGEDEIKERYGILPSQFTDVKALMGDSSDNVPGVAGIGEKSAFELIKKYGSLDRLYESLDEITGTRHEKLVSGKESAYLSRRLVTIDRAVPLDASLSDFDVKEPQKQRLLEKLRWLGFNSIIKKLDFTEISEQSASETSAVEISEIDAKKLADGLKAEKTLVLFTEGENLFVLKDGAVLKVPADIAAKEMKALFGDKDLPKITFGLKNLFRLAMRNGVTLENTVFDAETAGYLLNPSASGYTLAGAVSDLLNKSFASDAEALTLLPELRICCEKRLEEKGMTKLYREIELPLSEVLASMEHIGFAADRKALEEFGKSLSEKIDILTGDICSLAGHSFNINSPKQLGTVLFDELGLPARKKSGGGYSTDAAVLEKLIPRHEIIAKILEYRSLTKLKSTYADGLSEKTAADGRIHSTFLQTVTQTGRISSKEPNLQNIPVRREQGRELRKMLVASEGMTLCDGDYSQIELRVLADIAGDAAMTETFINGGDIHTKTASEVFGIPPEAVTPLLRTRAKAVNFGIVYGIGEYSLSQDLKISVAEARSYIQGYLATYGGVADYMERTVAAAKKDGFVTTAFGRIRYIPELSAANRNTVAFGERVARNTPIQGTAADIIKIAMIRVYNELNKRASGARLILQIHDELIVECPSSEADDIAALMKREMESAAQLYVPLVADVRTGKSWYDAK